MANETKITLIGNMTADPELRFTQGGKPVANFTVASTPRTFDRQANEWRDGDPMFLQCSVWNQYAQNVADTLTKGMRVIVHGDLKSRSYEAQDGSRRTVFQVEVDEVGPALRFATAKVDRASQGASGVGAGWAPAASQASTQADPWADQPRSFEPPF